MPKVFTSKSQKTGELGEDLAVKYLKNKGFTIIERNFTRKWGEIDIISRKKDIIHFVEVKSVSCETFGKLFSYGGMRPEENMHPVKLKKFCRTVEGFLAFDASNYIADFGKNRELSWQLDLLCVYMDRENKKAKVKVIGNIVG
jgi:putative endonuclease